MSREIINFNDYEFDFTSEKDYLKNKKFVESNLWHKVEKFGKKVSFLKDVVALFNYMKDKRVGWQRKTIVVAALLYFILPIDAIPDLAPFIGYLDDMGVITSVLKYLGKELIPYYD